MDEDRSVEISVKGKWVRVPSVDVNGTQVIIRGAWLKTASIHDEAWWEEEVADPQPFLDALRRDRKSADVFTFAQKVPGSQPQHSFALEWDSIAAIHLSTFERWWQKLPQETRKNVRRSQKRGVEIKVKAFDESLIAGIEDVNNDSAARQGERNYYYRKGRDELRKDYSAFLDRSDFICAYAGEEMIGFLKLVYRGEVASILNLTPKASHSDKRPANAMIARAVELCEARGVSYLTYGMYNYGNKKDSPLREFKARNGFEEILTPRFYLPLTTWGQISFKLNLHRGILGVLPQSSITALLDARSRWRRFMWQVKSRCSSMLERPNRNRQMERSNPPAGSRS